MAQLRVVPCTYQRGKARYSSNEDGTVPEVAQYRNNLTAMSQRENLLFVAYLDKVHVFRPDFPLQSLSKAPELIIDLPKSRSGRRGYLDLNCPHAANHLIVGDLGNEEIFVAACDDGDVISYTLHSINLAIEWTRENGAHPDRLEAAIDSQTSRDLSTLQSKSPVAKPWFLENVGHSAWGLAIHKDARLLAVSSNTQIIDIFAPALQSPGPPESEVTPDEDRDPMTEHSIGDEKWRTLTCYSPSYRVSNLRIRLYGHTTNIPNITFADVDHEGRYLASTDIEGNTFIWDIYRGSMVFQFQSSALPSMRGWDVVCLDKLTSRLTNSANQTFGCDGHTDKRNTVIDISEGCRSIPNNSQWHPGFAKYGAVPGADATDVPAILPEPQEAGSESESDELLSDGDVEILDESDDQVEPEAESETMDTEADQEEVLSFHSPPEHSTVGEGDAASPNNVFALETSTDNQSNNVDLLLTTEQNHGLLPASPPARERKADPGLPKDDISACKSVQLPFNLLQTSESDICLFRDIRYNPSSGETAHTRVISQQALHQKLPPGLHNLSHIERLNLIAQIPELSVVIIGNQVGRVGILTATRWQALQQSGYRVEYILPFKSQEEEGLRPQKALLGMAVGPLQGHAYSPGLGSARGTSPGGEATGRPISWGSSRRFRLLVFYCDHTVLSYEISRQSEDEILVI